MKEQAPAKSLAISLLFLSFVFLGMPGAVLSVGWPEIRDEFRLRQDSIGWLLLAKTLGHLTSGAFNGRLLACLGSGRTMVLSVVVYSAGLYGFWFSTSWSMLVLFGWVSGWGAATLDATGNTIVSTRYDERIMNWLHGFFGVGATLGPMVIALVVSAGSDWRGGALVFSALLAILGLALAVLRPFASNGRLEVAEDRLEATRVSEEPIAPSLQTLSKTVVWWAILFFFLYAGVEVTIGQWAFTLLTESREISADSARLYVSLYWGALTFGRFAFGWLSHMLPPRVWIRIFLVSTTAAVTLLSFPDQAYFGLMGLALSGLAQAPVFATLISYLPKLVGRSHAANTIGYVVGAAGIGLAILPWLAGVLAETFSLEAIPPFVLALTVLLIATFEWMSRSAERRDSGGHDRRQPEN